VLDRGTAAQLEARTRAQGFQWPYCLNLPRAVSIDSPLPMVLFINRVYVCVCVCVCAHVCAQSCPTLCDTTDCSLPGSSVHGMSQVRILEEITISSFRGSSLSRD